jgi:hypothetical protein
MITLRLILLIVAFILFLLTGLGVSAPRVNLLGLGFACWILAEMIR